MKIDIQSSSKSLHKEILSFFDSTAVSTLLNPAEFEFSLHLDSHWNSLAPDHREQLHQLRSEKNQYLYSSISHCPAAGAIAFANRPLGLDLESTLRVAPKTVERISTTTEIQFLRAASLHPAALWCAKEATFKALKHHTHPPQVLSQLECSAWTPWSAPESTSGLLFKAAFIQPSGAIKDLAGFGVVLSDEQLTLALFFPQIL